MTLARQLSLVVSAALMLVFAGAFFISLDNTRNYLAVQLDSHAQDAATSLGLSLSPHLADSDLATMEAMVNAVFDRGDYREVVVQSIDGTPLISRVREVQVDDVPDWFVGTLPLVTPQRSADLMDGWRRGGEVLVRSHPGYAYQELWGTAADTSAWLLGTLVLAILMVVAVLRVVLRPLQSVEAQALAIAGREFPQIEERPHTRELRRVVTAMNKMSEKVGHMLAEQVALAEQMRAEAYADPVTGLANRRAFERHLRQVTAADDEQQAFGALYLIRLSGLEEVNQHEGYAAGDEVLRDAAARLQAALGRSAALLSRIGGAEFAVVSPGNDRQEAATMAEEIGDRLAGLTAVAGAHIGVACYAAADDASAILAEADMALRRAVRQGPSAWHLLEADGANLEVHGAEGWRSLLSRVIERRAVRLLFQPVKAPDPDRTLHLEAFARIEGADGALLPAGLFVPMAERLGLAPSLDRLVVEAVLEQALDLPEVNVTVNLSPASIGDAQFLDWLQHALASVPDISGRILFELPEHAVHTDPDTVRALVEQLKAHGSGLILDHFGIGTRAFGYLRSLKLDFLKIDRGYVADLHENKDNQFFLKALIDIAHGLDIQVVAECVESEADAETLRSLGVDGLQGFLFGKPAAL